MPHKDPGIKTSTKGYIRYPFEKSKHIMVTYSGKILSIYHFGKVPYPSTISSKKITFWTKKMHELDSQKVFLIHDLTGKSRICIVFFNALLLMLMLFNPYTYMLDEKLRKIV